VTLAALLIVLYNTVALDVPHDSRPRTSIAKVLEWAPAIIQLSFGALFSGSLVFYSRSASLSVSWPFLLLLVAFMVGNELVHTRLSRLAFQLAGFFVSTFLYASFAIPTLVREISTGVFLLSGAVSLLATLSIVLLVKYVRREHPEKQTVIWTSVLSLYALFNLLYFTNLIPPLPLSLKEIGIYHTVVRSTPGAYELSYEAARWYHFRTINPVFHLGENKLAYAYSAVFAPTNLSTEIAHEWFYRDEEKNEWVRTGTISFVVEGGREAGFRGYSSAHIFPGKWRVEVRTGHGAMIGRTTFTVALPEGELALQTVLR
jgi:hypothetical protein